MLQFTAVMQQFAEKGEKTGWTYIEIPIDIALRLNPDNKKSFRVKGKLDSYVYEDISLLPMGGGSFIMPLNATTRKGIRKRKGASVKVEMEVDTYEKPLSADFIECISDEPKALKKFNSLPKGHQRYFSKWIEDAKTETTKTKRITQAVIALSMGLGFPEMIRMNKKGRDAL
jgi:hypothetical protein